MSGPFEDYGGMVSYGRELEEEMVSFCTDQLLERVPAEVFFPCEIDSSSSEGNSQGMNGLPGKTLTSGQR